MSQTKGSDATKKKDQLIFETLTMIAVQASVYNEQIAKSLQELYNTIAEERRCESDGRTT